MTPHPALGASSDPAPVAVAIVALLRVLPGPAADPSASPVAVAAWLTAKAELLERIATAAADPGLATRAALCATRARTAITRLPRPDPGSPEGAPR